MQISKIDKFDLIISSIILLSVAALFTAIFIDFIEFSEKNNVKKEKKSIVATGSMMAFFVLYYFLLRLDFGRVEVGYNFKNILSVIGTTIIFLGCIVNIIGRLNLGENWANHVKIYNNHKLVTNGVYKFVRHPLYSSIISMFYGGCLVYRSITAFLLVTLVFVPFMKYRARQEEELLTAQFKEYERYKENTGMFFVKIF